MNMSLDFVEFIPPTLTEGVLYISMKYGTAVHKCCCGCGHKVVTPITPTDWSLSFDGESVSLYPSIGNWQIPCQSHYWIKKNRVVWSNQWSSKKIEAGRKNDEELKKQFYHQEQSETPVNVVEEKPVTRKRSWFNWLFGK